MGRGVRQLLRHAARAGRGGARARAATCCSTSTGRARSSCATRCATDLVSVFVLPPSIAELERRLHDARAGFRRGHPRPHGQGGRRDEPLGGIRLRPDQPRSRRGFADVRAILAAERLKRERQPVCPDFVRGLQADVERVSAGVRMLLKRARQRRRNLRPEFLGALGWLDAGCLQQWQRIDAEDFRLCRSIFRRWPKAAAVTRSSVARSQGSGARRAAPARPATRSPSAAARRPTARCRTGSRLASATAPAPRAGHKLFEPGCGDDALGHLALEHQHQASHTTAARVRRRASDQQRRGDIVGQVGDDARRRRAEHRATDRIRSASPSIT